MGRPSSAVKPIVLSTLRPAVDRAHAGAAAEMGDHDPALGDLRRDLGQHARDVLVGQAVEAVAADALVVEPAGQGEPVGELGMAAVERGVEAGDLRQLGLDRGDRADRRRGCAAGAAAPAGRAPRAWRAPPASIAHRRRVVDAAVHHAVADRRAARSSPSCSRSQPPSTRNELSVAAGRDRPASARSTSAAPVGVLGDEARRGADALDLALGRSRLSRSSVAEPRRPRT